MKITDISEHPSFLPFSEASNDGRIGAFANVRGPRYDGLTRSATKDVVMSGIPVFPDKKYSGIRLGVVHVTALKPMWSKKGLFVGYAFVRGDMPQYEWPDKADIAEWLSMKASECQNYASATISWLRTANNGEIVMIVASSQEVTFLTRGPHEDILCRELDGEEYKAARECFFCRPARAKCVKRAANTLKADLLLMEVAFGADADKRIEVQPMKFGVIREGYGMCPPSDEDFGALVEEAERIGFLKQYCFAGRCYFRCTHTEDSRFWLVRYFSVEEVDELVRLVSKVNHAATEAYRNMVKKGRMKVQSYAGELCLSQEGQY